MSYPEFPEQMSYPQSSDLGTAYPEYPNPTITYEFVRTVAGGGVERLGPPYAGNLCLLRNGHLAILSDTIKTEPHHPIWLKFLPYPSGTGEITIDPRGFYYYEGFNEEPELGVFDVVGVFYEATTNLSRKNIAPCVNSADGQSPI